MPLKDIAAVPLPHQVRQREQGWVSETHSPKPSNIFLKLAAIERAKSISHAFLSKSLGSRSSSFIRPRTRKQKKKQIWASIPECLSSVKTDQLRCTVRQLMLPGLGILAADDSINQLGLRLNAIHLENTAINRRRYHEMLLNIDGASYGRLNDYLSGVLMREESMDQTGYSGKNLSQLLKERNVLLGIRFDKALEKLVGCDREYIASGLDSLSESIRRMKDIGVKFGLFRCVYRISDHTPSRLALTENSIVLARFAVICQQLTIVPILAPEVLAGGNHGYEEARGVLRDILTTLVKIMSEHRVYLAGAIIRVAACSPGLCFKDHRDLKRVANNMAKTLNESIPPAIGGILMSRQESLCESVAILNNIQICRVKKPFIVSFCFSRVIQQGVDSIWAGQNKNLDKARAELMRRAELCGLAAMGQWLNEATSIFISVESSTSLSETLSD
ncbi:hypothetical protein RRG08_041927 [Elysia crispata]|uniref:fructose-bisphosphate aldolase n=1 Tax=Elysia crispata TaxID=231223 RepID=A0AAE1CNN0_9GAST|nr:hypothetical protein RRG08_041927 [Elysia crispata]